jgi:DNA-directed RNA polymerase subunit L
MTSETDISFESSKNKFDIDVKLESYHESDGLDQSILKLKFSGKDFNIKMVNAMRRVAISNIPVYGFPSELITITTNTSIPFNNDYMRLRLSKLPVSNIDPEIYFLADKHWYKVNYADPEREKHPKEKLVELYINYNNESSEIVNVTTNDCQIYIDGEEKKNIYNKKYPVLLIKLKPTEKFQCRMKATFGVAENNTTWTAARNAFYDEEKNNFLLTVEGNWQYSEQELMLRVCKFIIHKIYELKKNLQDKINSKEILFEKTIYLTLDRETHTFGELLNYEFQSHKDIAFSGVSKPDFLIKSMLIKTISKSEKSPLDPMLECMDILIKKFKHIGAELTKVFKKK